MGSGHDGWSSRGDIADEAKGCGIAVLVGLGMLAAVFGLAALVNWILEML